MLVKLKKINITGERAFHVFRMVDGSEKRVETTMDDYKQLGEKSPKNPKIDNGTWIRSFSKLKFDTDNKEMSELEYAEYGDGYLVKYNKKIIFIKKEEIKNEEVEEDLLLKKTLDLI